MVTQNVASIPYVSVLRRRVAGNIICIKYRFMCLYFTIF